LDTTEKAKQVLRLPPAITRPTQRQLRQFAVVLPLAALAIGWGLGWSQLQLAMATLLGLLAALVGWLTPAAVKPIYVAVSLFAYPIGLIVSELVMLTVYFGLLTPIGLVFRAMRRDALERKIERQAESYWRKRKQPDSASSYLRRW
jgi:hypothetical protein